MPARDSWPRYVVVTRPNGDQVQQGLPADLRGAERILAALATLVPLDATWAVRPGQP